MCFAWLVVYKELESSYENKADLAIIDKRRPAPGKSQVMNIIGDVKKKTCIIVDDIIDSGGTIVNAVEALKKAELMKSTSSLHTLYWVEMQ